MLCPIALYGAQYIPNKNVLTVGQTGFSYHQGLKSTQIDYWRMSKAKLDKLKKTELSMVGHLIDPERLNEFSLSIRSSLLLYSMSTTFVDPADRLVYTLTALEEVLLRHTMESISFNIGERVGLLLSQQKEERLIIAQNIRNAYHLRARHGALFLTSHDEKIFALCVTYTHMVLKILIKNLNHFMTKSNFINALEQQKEIN